MSFEVKQGRQEIDGVASATGKKWRAYLKGHVLKEGYRDLLYYTVFFLAPPLILKINVTFLSYIKRYMCVFCF